MGLGGVAIAVLPSVAYPQTVVLGQAGGGNKKVPPEHHCLGRTA